ncbi:MULTISPECIES: hypothetical protein [unclassified Streptomyces]|uniref:hypothetical protein n=1 Tax=unclassified Streptomyces TaxID=2593676 RepID=UPI0003A3A834|nr:MULTISPECIES: hypothetical protein [unclassified Streptomyces]MYT31716.1 hypothetical protein [Streptomyces sp. SID8354]
MAALVYFKKINEDLNAIVYSFGEDPSEMTRHLTMDKSARRSQSDDGNIDYLFLKASRKINAMYEQASEWPDRGMSAS